MSEPAVITPLSFKVGRPQPGEYAPYYERLGFQRLTEAEMTPGLMEVRARETGDGLDPKRRVSMRLNLNQRDSKPPAQA